jgi:hypothetical protein
LKNSTNRNPKNSKNFRLPTEYAPIDLYLSRRKIHAEYTVDNNARTIDTEAFMTYAAKDHAALAHVYLPPDVLLSQPDVADRSDVHSVGRKI